MSPGRRQRQLQAQQNKSLDLDSGYSGSWTGPANYQQSTTSGSGTGNQQQQQQLCHQQQQQSSGLPLSVCSPHTNLLESELIGIKTEQVDNGSDCNSQSWLSHGSVNEESVSLLPSFPDSFKPEVNLIPAPPEESLDDLDEEIKMIVARAEHREGTALKIPGGFV